MAGTPTAITLPQPENPPTRPHTHNERVERIVFDAGAGIILALVAGIVFGSPVGLLLGLHYFVPMVCLASKMGVAWALAAHAKAIRDVDLSTIARLAMITAAHHLEHQRAPGALAEHWDGSLTVALDHGQRAIKVWFGNLGSSSEDGYALLPANAVHDVLRATLDSTPVRRRWLLSLHLRNLTWTQTHLHITAHERLHVARSSLTRLLTTPFDRLCNGRQQDAP